MNPARKLLVVCLFFASPLTPLHAWNWGANEDIATPPYQQFKNDLQQYRQKVSRGLSKAEQIQGLHKIISDYKPLGIDTASLELEYSHLVINEREHRVQQASAMQNPYSANSRIESLIAEGQYKDAVSVLEKLALNRPLNDAENRLLTRLTSIAIIAPVENGKAKASVLIRKAIDRYLANDPARALNALRYVADIFPTRGEVHNLTSLVLNEYPSLGTSRIPTGMTLVDEKLQEALEHIYQGRFLEAVKECHVVLDLDPTNVWALARLGSAYYALGNYDQARTYWHEAMVLDPSHPALRGFVSSPSTKTYRVRKGDTLQTIAEKLYGGKSSWRRIYQANKAALKNPYQLSAGQTLRLP